MWTALAYHAAYFTAINSMAWLFAALLVLQAAILLATGFPEPYLPVTWSAAHSQKPLSVSRSGPHEDVLM